MIERGGMEFVSQHNHTGFTGHGEGSVEQLITQASKLGMTNIAVTEHYPLSKAIDEPNYISMPKSSLPLYKEQILEQRAKHPEMEILVGCELDWLGDDEDRTFAPDEFDDFDIILGSVHYLDLWPFDDPEQKDYWDKMSPRWIWDRYFEVWCEAVTSSAPFTVMAHPDLVKKFNIYPEGSIKKYYSQAAEAARAGNRMIEVNTSGLFYACKELYPNIDLLREFCRAGVPCTIGTDAHTALDVNRAIVEGYRHMYEAGYRELTVVVPGGDRRVIPLS